MHVGKLKNWTHLFHQPGKSWDQLYTKRKVPQDFAKSWSCLKSIQQPYSDAFYRQLGLRFWPIFLVEGRVTTCQNDRSTTNPPMTKAWPIWTNSVAALKSTCTSSRPSDLFCFPVSSIARHPQNHHETGSKISATATWQLTSQGWTCPASVRVPSCCSKAKYITRAEYITRVYYYAIARVGNLHLQKPATHVGYKHTIFTATVMKYKLQYTHGRWFQKAKSHCAFSMCG